MNQKEKLGKVTAKGARFSRISAMSTGSKIAMGLLALIVLVSILAPYVSPYGPDEIFDKWSAPSGEHLFGTDHVGRDIFARVLFGGRFSLMIGLCSTLIALFFGAIIGSIAAVVRKAFFEAKAKTASDELSGGTDPFQQGQVRLFGMPIRQFRE